jgi:hypothetical protein
MNASRHHRAAPLLAAWIVLILAGCQGSVSPLVPINDSELRKPPVAFSKDAAGRNYEAEAPRAQTNDFRGDYALILKQVDLANISAGDCSNVEVWLNGKYVVFCPNFAAKSDKTLTFHMFYDKSGHYFDTDWGKNPVHTVEVFHDGVMYDVPIHVAD